MAPEITLSCPKADGKDSQDRDIRGEILCLIMPLTAPFIERSTVTKLSLNPLGISHGFWVQCFKNTRIS
jgi:hypothetical protein